MRYADEKNLAVVPQGGNTGWIHAIGLESWLNAVLTLFGWENHKEKL